MTKSPKKTIDKQRARCTRSARRCPAAAAQQSAASTQRSEQKPQRKPMNVSTDALIISSSKPSLQQDYVDARQIFMAAAPPPGVVPQGTPTMAMDEGIENATNWALASYVSMAKEGITFLGYPYLSELAQRAEYRTITGTIAGEMCRKWIKIKSTSNDTSKGEKINQIMTELKRLKARQKFKRAAELDGFFGRGHIAIDLGTSDQPEEMKTPIGNGRDTASKQKVPQGTKLGLRVVEPMWIYPAEYNTSNPLLPNWYAPAAWYVMGMRVHASRIMTFISREVPDILKPAYSFGGVSLSQLAKPYIDNWLRTRQSISDLVHSFSTAVLMSNLEDVLQGNAGTNIAARADFFNNMRDNRGILLIDKETEDFTNVSVPLSGLEQLQAQAQEHMCAVSQIPLVKFAGIQPTGLNASSEGEIKVFYDMIHDRQEDVFGESIHNLLGFIQLSLYGEVDEDLVHEFVPLTELSELEKSQLRKQDAETDTLLIDSGVIAPAESRKRIAEDPETLYHGLDVDDVPDLKMEEMEGLQPKGAKGASSGLGGEDGGEGTKDSQRASYGDLGRILHNS